MTPRVQPQQVFFKLRVRQSPLLARRRTPGRRTHEGYRGMCSDPVDPGGEVRGCCVGCTIAMSDVSPFVFIVTAGKNIGFLELKKCFFKRRCFECGGICWCSDWHKIVFFVSAPLDVSLNVMPHTASRRSLLSAARSSSSLRRLLCSNTRRVFYN